MECTQQLASIQSARKTLRSLEISNLSACVAGYKKKKDNK